MKFLILLVIIGFVAAAPVSKEDLLKRATDLETRLAAAEEKVRTSNPVEAKILEAELKTLKVLSKDLEGAKEAAVVARLELALDAAERAADATLKRIETFFVAAPTKEELIKTATDLLTRLAAAIAKVKDSKPEEVIIMDVEAKNLKTIVKELEAAKEPAVVARLETVLASVEATVEKRLKQNELPVFSVAAPTKEELLKRATDLEARLTAAEAKVKTSKPAEARMIEGEIKSLQTLSKELTAATEAAVVARLETRLTSVERTAEILLRRIEGGPGTTAGTTAASFVGAPTKEELLKRATDLEARLTAAEAKVKTSKPTEARMIEAELRSLQTLSKELTAATEAAVVARLETRLTSVERTAEALLRRIEGGPGTTAATTAASF